MLADAALASAAATWSQESDHSRPPCPACGAPLQSRGAASRDLQTQAGEEITLTRSYGTCSAWGAGPFPPRLSVGVAPRLSGTAPPRAAGAAGGLDGVR